MLLPRDPALRFIEGYKSILLKVLEDTGSVRTDSITDDLASSRTQIKTQPELLIRAISSLIAKGTPLDEDVIAAVKGMKIDQWVYLRHTKTFAVFIDKEAKNAYQVKALTTPLYELVDEPPFLFEAGLFEYMGHFVCDGLAIGPIALGPGYKAQFKAAYSSIREAGRLHVRSAASQETPSK
jgi:hypothetical protein